MDGIVTCRVGLAAFQQSAAVGYDNVQIVDTSIIFIEYITSNVISMINFMFSSGVGDRKQPDNAEDDSSHETLNICEK